ncbi:MAG: hypothetical protein Q8Q25_02580 [bacterium]|nr:hypothetical protein [bacterium]
MKKINLLLGVSLFLSSLTRPNDDLINAIVWGAIGAGAAGLKHGYPESSPLKTEIYKTFNTDADDFLSWFAFAAFFKGGSYFVGDRTVRAHLNSGIEWLTITMIINKLIITSSWYNRLINCIPLVNSFLGCSHKNCDGICNKCKFKKINSTLLMGIPLSLLFHELARPRYA